jgi:uncharacterized membrane protein YfcA
VAGAGGLAGAVNAIAGGGSLISFPALLACGYSPLTANVTNSLGVVPGTVGGSIGYRRELAGQGRRMISLGVPIVLGAIAGAVVLLVTPESAFDVVVPFLVAASCLLVLFQPRLARLLASRSSDREPEHSRILAVSMFLAGVYGGYFGAAISVLLLGLLGLFVADGMQRLNALKGALAGTANLVAAVVFVFAGPVAWPAAGLLAGGSIVGGRLGAGLARKVPPTPLRICIAVAGLVVAVVLLVT